MTAYFQAPNAPETRRKLGTIPPERAKSPAAVAQHFGVCQDRVLGGHFFRQGKRRVYLLIVFI